MYSSQSDKNRYNIQMKLVILAAGKGSRMGTLGEATPKPILKYKGKNLIQHKLEQLPENIDEIIIVIGHLGEQIVETIGSEYNGIPVTYVWQKELLGTGHSLWTAKEYLKDSRVFEVFGLDFVLDTNLNLWFIECNGDTQSDQ